MRFGVSMRSITAPPVMARCSRNLAFTIPPIRNLAKQVVLNKARYEFWVSRGAQPSETVGQIAKRAADIATLVVAKTPAAV